MEGKQNAVIYPPVVLTLPRIACLSIIVLHLREPFPASACYRQMAVYKNRTDMKFLSIEPFVPSGSDFDKARQLFQALGFHINWDAGDYVGFEKDGCKFILQKYDHPEFAHNLMISVAVDDVQAFSDMISQNQLTVKFGIRISEIKQQPYGREMNLIDTAGVCWHFVQS